MAQYQTDEEQLEILKKWWRENGSPLVLMVVLALAAYFGWQWWTQHQKNYSQQASALFQELTEAVADTELTDEKRATAQFLITQLQNDFGRSFYAASASLISAKLAVKQGDLSKAEGALKKALEHGDQDIEPIATLRLGRIYLAQGNYEEALKMAEYEGENNSLSALFAILKGDVLKENEQKLAARKAYQQALDIMETENSMQRRMVEIKLLDLPQGDES